MSNVVLRFLFFGFMEANRTSRHEPTPAYVTLVPIIRVCLFVLDFLLLLSNYNFYRR